MKLRHPRTFPECRAAAHLVVDETARCLRIRPRRGDGRDSLPSEYSDLEPQRQRSWKRYRATRYK